jgi:hypothetical protein
MDRLGLPHQLFHLVLHPQLQLLQPDFLELFFFCKEIFVGKEV